MILKDKRFDSIKDKILLDIYNRLMNRNNRVVEEDKKIRVNLIEKLCDVHNDDEVDEILKGIAPLLRNKRRSIFLMGGTYKEVNKQKEKAIFSYMTSISKIAKESAYSEGSSLVNIKFI